MSGLIEIAVGREHFRHGVVTLVVHGDGAAEVAQLRAGERATWAGRVEGSRVEELDALEPAGLQASGRDREPDDDPVRVVADGHEAQLWHGDRYEDERLDRLLRLWQELVEQVTDGALPYGDPA